MRHVAGDMHPPTSVHEMRAAPGTKSWTKAALQAALTLYSTTDSGFRAAHRDSTQA